MKLAALGLVDGGAVLVDADSGYPLAIEPRRFLDQADAESFIEWLGEPCGSLHHIRDLVRRWATERDWLTCPTCPDGKHGRVAPGNSICDECREELYRDRGVCNGCRAL